MFTHDFIVTLYDCLCLQIEVVAEAVVDGKMGKVEEKIGPVEETCNGLMKELDTECSNRLDTCLVH